MRTAILLIAHGSRRPEANADLAHLAHALRERCADEIVEVGFLELAEPSIPAGARRCVEQGARRVRMLPYFLSAGRHVQEDLLQFQQQLQAEHPGVNFELCPHLGLHPQMVEIVLDRLAGSTASLISSSATAAIRPPSA